MYAWIIVGFMKKTWQYFQTPTMMITKKKCALFLVVIISVVMILKISHNLLTLFTVKTGELSFCREGSSTTESKTSLNSIISPHIHQIFFNMTEKTIPVDLELARQSWIQRNKQLMYTLWNSKMAVDLIKSKYPELLPLYESYTYWVRRADVLRYVILHEFGGIYVDLDIGCKSNIYGVVNNLPTDPGVVLYLTKPFGVSNDFIVAKPKHPFLKHVICGLESAHRWYGLPFITTIMATGPGYLYSKYKTFEHKDDILILTENHLKPYIKHQDGGAWHGNDAKLIWWLFLRWELNSKTTFLVICVFFVLVLISFKFRHKLIYWKHK